MIIKDVNDSQSKLVLRRALFHIICSTCDACDASFTSHDIRSLTETLHFLPYDALMLANFTFMFASNKLNSNLSKVDRKVF
jgi:hypothetical protein